MKIDIIIGHSNTHESRDRNLRFIVKRYQELLPQGEITIVEQNTESDLTDLKVERHLLRKTPEPFDYSRGFGFNEGVRDTEGQYIIFSDNDIMLHEDLLKNFEELVEGYDFYIPSQKFLNISRHGTQEVIGGAELKDEWIGRNRPRVANNGAGESVSCLEKVFMRYMGGNLQSAPGVLKMS